MEKRYRSAHGERHSRHTKHRHNLPKTVQNINYEEQREARRRFFRFLGASAGYLVAAAAGLSADSARPSELDFANDQVKQLTRFDLASWKNVFDLDLEEFVYNPQVWGNYVVALGQIHHGPKKAEWGQYEDRFLKSQDSIEKVLTHFSRKKPLSVFVEGVTDENIDDIYRVREIKNKVEAAQLDLPTIVRMSSELNTDIFRYISREDLQLPVEEQRFYELYTGVLYIYEKYLNKAYEFLLRNPNIEISAQVESLINSMKGDSNLTSYEFLIDSLDTQVRHIQQTASFWGAPDIRSTLSAPFRLFIDGVIEFLPSESLELNQKLGVLEKQVLSASQAVLKDPLNEKLREEFYSLRDQYYAADRARNQKIIEIITSASIEDKISFAIFGENHVWSSYITEQNTINPSSQFGLISLGKEK